jgi:hypothetical protein
MVSESEAASFDKEPGAIVPKFLLTLHTLLGHVHRLDKWGGQFYIARSKIVHTGRAPALCFVTPTSREERQRLKQKRQQQRIRQQPTLTDQLEEQLPLGSLTDIGKNVFRLCLTTILAGHEQVKKADVGSQLIHNEERLRTCCDVLNGPEDAYTKFAKLNGVVRQMNSTLFVSWQYVYLDTWVTAVQRMVAVMRSIESEWPPPVVKHLTDFENCKGVVDQNTTGQILLAISDTLTDELKSVAHQQKFESAALFLEYCGETLELGAVRKR